MERSLDYNELKKVGLEYIQKVSGKIWTDHNAHDPGITILEQLCYALVDLGFRTSFNIKDILTKNGTNVPATEEAMIPAHEILSSSPISIDDYRKMILENFRGKIRNIWFSTTTRPIVINKINGREDVDKNIVGYYDCKVELTKKFSKIEEKEIGDNVLALLRQNRNVCEGFNTVTFLGHEEVGINAQIVLERETDYNSITHEIEKRLYDYISPEMPYYSYEEMAAKGKSVDDIFLGSIPLPGNGFIDRDDLDKLEQRRSLYISDVKNLVLSIDGVKSIKHLHFTFNDKATKTIVTIRKRNELLPGIENAIKQRTIPENIGFDSEYKYRKLIISVHDLRDEERFLYLVENYLKQNNYRYTIRKPIVIVNGSNFITLSATDKVFALRHLTFEDNDINHIQYIINDIPFMLGRNLEYIPTKWDEDITAQKTNKKVVFDIPEGEYRETDVFYPVQHEFAENYKVGKEGISSNETAQRKVQRLQLKAYLTFFDQLLSDYLMQLSSIDTLFSWKEDNSIYFHHVLTDEEIVDVSKVMEHNDWCYEQSIKEKVLNQKNTILNHVLARFNEAFVDYSMFKFFENTRTNGEQFGFNLEETIRDKKNFLSNYAYLGYNRTHGINLQYYKNPKCDWLVSPIEEKIMRRIGVNTERERQFLSLSCKKRTTRSASKTRNVINENDFSSTFGVRILEHNLLVPDGDYRFYSNTFLKLLENEDGNIFSEDPYSMQITAICPGWLPITHNSYFRQIAERIIREEIPAHISIKVCWLSQEVMQNVEERYYDYLKALNGTGKTQIKETLKELVTAFGHMKNIYPPSRVFDYNEKLMTVLTDDITQVGYAVIGEPESGNEWKHISFDCHYKYMNAGSSFALKLYNAYAKPIEWTSSDTKVAKVDSMGIVSAVGEGEAKITAIDQNGHSDTCVIRCEIKNKE